MEFIFSWQSVEEAHLVLKVMSGSGELHGLSLQLLPGLCQPLLLQLILSLQSLGHLLMCLLHLSSNLREREREREGGGGVVVGGSESLECLQTLDMVQTLKPVNTSDTLH